MNNRSALVAGALLVGSALSHTFVFAEEHAAEALKHTNEALNSPGDSSAIRQHAAEALKHLEAAKEANAHRPEVVEHLEKGEAELRGAIEHASHYNATTATDTATDAKAHLENARSAAQNPDASKPLTK